MQRFARMFVTTSLLLLVSVAAYGQATNGILTGTVMTEGAPLPGVTVTITSPSLQGTRTAVTGANGDYIFQALPPGRYAVNFSLEGMAEVTKTTIVTLSQTQRADAELRLSGIAEAITVTASAPSVLENVEISTNFDADLMEKLPTGRSVQAAAALAPGTSPEGPNNQLMISGAPSYENLYLVNGAVINDTIRGQAESVFIDDAIQETTVLTGNISSEYGRFTGGVVSAITKSGGNEFSGSLRDTLTNDDWTRKTPFQGQADPVDELNEVYEGTFGGRIIRDRLWFFTAARLREEEGTAQTLGTNIPFVQLTEEERYEGKLTASVTSRHSLVASYLDRLTTQQNNRFGAIVDLASLTDRELPNTLLSFNYNGILTENLLIEALYSEREFAFVGGGASSRDRIAGTIIRDLATGRRGNSPTFCGVCSDKTRNNEYWILKSSYFLSTDRMGTHNVTAGYEDFAELRNENNEQGGSGYRVFGNFIYQGQDVFLEVEPGTSFIQNFPVLNLSQTSSSATESIFLNDKWNLNSRLSFNLGIRYDKNDSVDQAGNKTSDDDAISPRLGATFDVFGDGRHRVFGGYNQYVSKIDNGINDSASNAGAPAYFGYTYNGPAINAGDGPYLPTDEVLRQVFAWFEANGGDSMTADRGVSLAGVNVQLDGELVSPTMDEFSLGYGVQVGSRSYLRADLISREWKDFYVERTNLSTGRVSDDAGNEFDLTLVGNSDDGLERKYAAVQLQGSTRLFSRLALGGNYTWSELEGNADSETFNNATITLTSAESFPEYLRSEFNNPVRSLTGDVRHRAILYATWDLPTPVGNFSLSLLERYNSGFPYYAAGTISLSQITNPGYVNPPTTGTYFFDEGEFRTEDVTRTDIAVNYALPIFGLEFFIQADVLNVFDEDAIDDPQGLRTTVLTSRQSACRQGANGPTPGGRCLAFNPITTTPVRGIHYELHPEFGEPTSPSAYQLPLTYQASLGFRF